MTDAEALVTVKNSLNLVNDTSFDEVLADFIDRARRRLYPRAKFEVAAVTIPLTDVEHGETTIDLSSLDDDLVVTDSRLVEAGCDGQWRTIDDKLHHGGTLRLRDVPQAANQLRIYGLSPFKEFTDIYEYLLQPFIWLAMSDFYDYLAGNKAKYNIYMQTTGARAVDNMRDESLFFEQRAIDELDRIAQEYSA